MLPAHCEGNPVVTGGFPSQRASTAGNRFHVMTSAWWLLLILLAVSALFSRNIPVSVTEGLKYNVYKLMLSIFADCCDYSYIHRLVTWAWWRHQMETFSALLYLCAGNSPVTSKFPSQRPVTRSFDVFMICAWTNSWVHNRDAGDLRRHWSHYDATVMELHFARVRLTNRV